jgi:hypothetical protein
VARADLSGKRTRLAAASAPTEPLQARQRSLKDLCVPVLPVLAFREGSMAVNEGVRSSGLRLATPIRCDECDGRAQLVAQGDRAFAPEKGDVLTFQCENCGQKMYRSAD